MRAYGVSPLYGIVEHVCRSWRLFAVSIVLATVVVSSLAYSIGGMYTARALIVLGDKPDPAAADGKPDGARRRLNMLGVFQRDPEFMKTAIRNAIAEQTHAGAVGRHVWPKTGQPVDYHFDTSYRGAALDTFCARAAQSISVSNKEGVLEIASRWPDSHAVDIVNAFYWAFHDEVVNYETADSKNQETMLTKLLEDYKATETRLEQKLARYGKDHAVDLPGDSGGGVNRYAAMVTALADLQGSILQLQERRNTYANQLKAMQPKILSMEIRGRPTDTPVYLAAMQKRNEAQQKLDTLKAKYQDKHPMVQEAQSTLDAAEIQFKNAEKQSNATPNIQQQTTIPNPEYDRTTALINQADADLKGMRATWELKHIQAAAEKKRELAAGTRMNEQKSLSDQRAAMHATRASLESRLEAAQLASKQDILRASLQTSLLSKPVAQRDAAGGMAFLLYAAGPLLGLAIGILLSVFAKNQDHTLRTPLEVEQRLGVPVLAVLPKMETPRVSRTRIGGGGESGQSSLPPG